VSEAVLCLREPPIFRVRLNRPERRNAFDGEMIALLRESFEVASTEKGIRVVILDAEGEVFCGGADLGYMRRQALAGPDENRADARRMAAMFAAIAECPRPVVAAVRGAALGGGCGLVAASDIALAACDAVFGFTEVRLGLIPAVISPFVLSKVHPGDARRYFLTGEKFDAAEALRIGLIQGVGAGANLERDLNGVVDALLAGAPEAQGEIKELLRALPGCPEGERASVTAEWIARVRGGTEGREGMAAFLERRPAAWSVGSARGR
jgi:methylglutaconyl-CoA hydratase